MADGYGMEPKQMKRPKMLGFWIVFITYVLLFITDVTTTLALGDITKYLETNPLYKYTGFTGIIILNLGIIWCLYWFYTKRSNPDTRFMFFNIMGMVILARIYAIRNALYWLKNPITLQQAQVIATEAAKTQTQTEMAVFAFIPYFYCIIVYIFWRLDHHAVSKD